ncbi:MAG: AAA family ATPase [Oscillatoria sp. SIO1A7]|nr:AAA family ATPase [Oscillatoria sp. SIO1A7]
MLALSNYHLKENLYQGKRTEVYRGIRASDRQPVIIKILRNPHPNFKELVQFRNQYIITDHLEHLHIVKPIALERYGNGYALVMPDDGAIALWDYWQESDRSLAEFLSIAIQMSVALHYLSEQRIIHKDIKPTNILIDPETRQVQLIDFSIASLLPREQQQLINPNVLEGTLAYISPEQTGRMNRGIDYRTDFYSLGVTFFELLTGELPFASSDPMELVYCHIAKMPPALGNGEWGGGKIGNGRAIPQVIENIVMKLMAKNAEERYQSALGLKHDLERCLQDLETTGEIMAFELGQRDFSSRFLIPEKLYGREKEVQALLDAFLRVASGQENRVAAGNSEMMLVAGFSGIGKTAVINEVHKPIVKKRGYFIKGKFDQFNRNIPFSAFVQAFRDLMGQLLGESDAQLANWKAKILEVLGDNAQVIIDVVPELELIVGKQPPVPELSGSAAQNRFNLLFQKFIAVFATSEHPLVLFVDDLQWVDSASLNLIKTLMGDRDTGYLLLLGAYRDNEVFPMHPLMLTLSELEKNEAVISKIVLKPLAWEHINQLVAETLSCGEKPAQPLTELTYQKAQGNPFFTSQFLQGLYQEKHIEFNIALGYWQCDLAKVVNAALTDDVVEFMAGRLALLPIATQNLLKLAACIGNQFDLETLAIVSEQSQTEATGDLWPALREGLILPMNEFYKFFQYESDLSITNNDKSIESGNCLYRFLHDRVQQAAYSLISKQHKQAVHYHIGNLLFEGTSPEERGDRIFEIVNQINHGLNLINEEGERDEFAKLNLIACRKARSGTAYEAAREYATVGLKLLGSNAWDKDYATTLKLHEIAAEADAILGDFEAMDRWIQAVMKNGKRTLDKLEVYTIEIQALTTQHKFLDAIAYGQSVLKEFGVEFPEPITPVELEREIEEIQASIGDRSIEELLQLPVMVNPEKLAIVKIASRMIPACYLASSPLFPLLASLQTKLSLQYGNSPVSSTGYADYGMFILQFKKNLAIGNQFGQLAYRLASSAKDKNIPAITFVPVGLFLYHHQHHLRETLPILQAGYQAALETGKLEYVGHHSQGLCLNSFWSGQPLKELEFTVFSLLELVKKFKLISEKYCSIIWETIVFLLSNIDGGNLKIVDKNNEKMWISELLDSHDATRIFYFYIHRLFLRFMFADVERAKSDAIQARKYIAGGFATVVEAGFYFYDSAIALAAITEYDLDIEAELGQVENNQANLKLWAEYAPMNYLHKWQLVEAEKYRVLGKKYEAGDFYDRAIAGAKENEYLQEEALANELAAKFYLDWGKDKVAAGYMQEAYYCYARWGAKAKTDRLEAKYPQLLTPILQLAEPSSPNASFSRSSNPSLFTLSSTGSNLDLTSTIKASQALSEEIELDALLYKLIRIVRENAGADKAALILNNEGTWETVAQCANDNCQLTTTINLDRADLPSSIINTVKRTQQSLFVNNVEQEKNLASDPYFSQEQPLSLCCNPILYIGKLIGILYLENNLATDAFTPDRIEVLNLLTAQAAISIENARLYSRLSDYSHNLEDQVEQRTEELQEKNLDLQATLVQLQRTQAQLIQTEKMSSLGQMVAGIAHEINNPINFIAGNIGHAREYFQEFLELLRLYEEEWPNASEAIEEKVEEMNLEFLREDLEKLLDSMKNGSDRIRNIVLGLRNFSRLDEAGRKQADIHEGLENTLTLVQHRLKALGERPEITIVKNYAQLPLVNCYASQLNQVFLHIISNAIDVLSASDAGKSPEIRIATEVLDAQTVRIRIADNGPGMSPRVCQKAFDPFFTTKPVGQGTGLGLSISYQIVTEQHGGQLHCISQPGVGTEFAIALPIEGKVISDNEDT